MDAKRRININMLIKNFHVYKILNFTKFFLKISWDEVTSYLYICLYLYSLVYVWLCFLADMIPIQKWRSIPLASLRISFEVCQILWYRPIFGTTYGYFQIISNTFEGSERLESDFTKYLQNVWRVLSKFLEKHPNNLKVHSDISKRPSKGCLELFCLLPFEIGPFILRIVRTCTYV
jgi:hypothetical protein